MSNPQGGDKPPDSNHSNNDNNIIIDDNLKDINSFNLQNKYSSKDQGPFFVFVEHLNKNFGRLFPMKIGYFLLSDDKFKSDIEDITSVGVNRVKVVFKHFTIANSLINSNIITSNQLVAYIPTFYNHRKGIVRMIDTYFTTDYLLKNIECPNGKVVEVKRMKRKITDHDGTNKLVDRQLIIVTFEGNVLPNNIRINLTNFPVEPYIHPVVQCYNCLRYGHTSKLCKSKAQRCQKCTEIHDNSTNCENEFCLYCQTTDHKTISKSCPMYNKQFCIKREMATRNLSFKEAETLVNNPSYSKVVTNNRFSILNNFENFPCLPTRLSETQRPVPAHIIQKPKFETLNKKRKISSPPISPLPRTPKKTKNPFPQRGPSILPNPYREEFLQYKEKLINVISQFINSNFNPQNDFSLDNTVVQTKIREQIENVFYNDNVMEIVSLSDDDESTY